MRRARANFAAASNSSAKRRAHTNLGGVLLAQRHVADAIAEYRLALDITTGPARADGVSAWTLATSSDGALRRPAEAVHLRNEPPG